MNFSRVLLQSGHGDLGDGKFDPGATIGPYSEAEIVGVLVGGVVQARSLLVPTEHGLVREFGEVTRVPSGMPLGHAIAWVNGAADKHTAFLSVHMNSAISAKARGVEVVIADGAPAARAEQAAMIAEIVAKSLRIPLRSKPVIREADTPRKRLAAVRDTRCPAFILEIGFLSNPDDRRAVLMRGICAVGEVTDWLLGED